MSHSNVYELIKFQQTLVFKLASELGKRLCLKVWPISGVTYRWDELYSGPWETASEDVLFTLKYDRVRYGITAQTRSHSYVWKNKKIA